MDSIVNTIVLAFSLGLVTNLHCIGMCGPITRAIPLDRQYKATITRGITSCSIGRSLSYTLIGIIVSLFMVVWGLNLGTPS